MNGDDRRGGWPVGLQTFRRAEWAVVVVASLVIIAVNKLVVHDHGNTWIGLVVVSFWIGVTVVWANRWRSRRP